jgi:hypothetical protein
MTSSTADFSVRASVRTICTGSIVLRKRGMLSCSNLAREMARLKSSPSNSESMSTVAVTAVDSAILARSQACMR